jgi:hypothetical protein
LTTKTNLKENTEVLSGVLNELSGGSPTGDILSGKTLEEFQAAKGMSTIENPWFTEANIQEALTGLAYMLRPEALKEWLEQYNLGHRYTGKTVGMVLAGNIPMVGFHDIFTTCLAGHKALVKTSSQDRRLLPFVFKAFNDALGAEVFEIEWTEGKLQNMDAVIATGSNNTSRYFEYYFKKYPHIIRKNRSSVAILTGDETDEELKELGRDIFSYFGMGCRNVSKLYFKNDFDLDRFFEAIYDYNDIINHHKYANNYDYYRALWMMNREDLLENGFLVLRPSEAIASPIATLFYERFTDETALRNTLKERAEEIQCVVSKKDVPFGQSQSPELWDYADGVDTAEFLLGV